MCRSLIRWSLLAGMLLAGFPLASLTATAARAADLEMVDAFGNVTGVVEVSRKGVLVIENTGNRWFYQRARRYDLPGGRYLGFYNTQLNRAIRFPFDGSGYIERADFDHPLARFSPATVSVRPLGTRPIFTPYLQYWQVGTTLQVGVPLVPLNTPYPYPGVLPASLPPTTSLATLPYGLAASRPRSVLVDSRIIAAKALPPVEIALLNSGMEPLVITLMDHEPNAKGTASVQYTLAGGATQRVKLPRQGNATSVEVYETIDAAGLPIQQEVRRSIPPQPRYEVVVRKEIIQSIAIDRTGKSPNPIEDINRQAIGLGSFQLPAGDRLKSRTVDVLQQARVSGNAGLIQPLSR